MKTKIYILLLIFIPALFAGDQNEPLFDVVENYLNEVIDKSGHLLCPKEYQLAMEHYTQAKEKEQILTGILYLDPNSQGTHEILGTTETPLNSLGETRRCLGWGTSGRRCRSHTNQD